MGHSLVTLHGAVLSAGCFQGGNKSISMLSCNVLCFLSSRLKQAVRQMESWGGEYHVKDACVPLFVETVTPQTFQPEQVGQ